MFSTVSVSNLVKIFDHQPVLRNIDLELRSGEVCALLGANGSGKSTLLHLLSSLSKPTAGEIRYGETTLAKSKDRGALRCQIGWLAHQPFLYPELDAIENLRFFAQLYDVGHSQERLMELIRLTGLEHAATKKMQNYSRGMVQRLNLARVMLKNPTLWLLDEPFSGIDKNSIKPLSELLLGLVDETRLMVLVTHRLELVSRLCRRVIILSDGKIAFDGRITEETDVSALADRYF